MYKLKSKLLNLMVCYLMLGRKTFFYLSFLNSTFNKKSNFDCKNSLFSTQIVESQVLSCYLGASSSSVKTSVQLTCAAQASLSPALGSEPYMCGVSLYT